MKKIIFTFLFTTMISFTCWGEWTFAVKNERGDSYFVDLETIKKQKGYVYFWELVDYVKPLQGIADSAKNYIVADCNLLVFKYIKDIYYSEPMGKGNIVHTGDIPDVDWRFIARDSTGAVELKYVCDFIN